MRDLRCRSIGVLLTVALLVAGCTTRTASVLPAPPYDAFAAAEAERGVGRAAAADVPPAARAITAAAVEPHAYAGLPRSTSAASAFTVLENAGYSVGYSESYKDPVWAVYYCAAMDDPDSPGKRPTKFKKDQRTTAQLVHANYTQSDYQSNSLAYDRGHMAPNYAIGTRYGREAQLETFFMSNVCPQRKTLNQQTWEALEKRIATDYAWEYDGVWVTVGPIFDTSSDRLNGKAAIPDAFYAIIVDDENGWVRALAVRMDQSVKGVQPLREYVTTVRAIEEATGLDFLHDLPDSVEQAVETGGPDEYWELDRMMIPSRWN